MADGLICPICKTKAKPLDKIGDADGFECQNHGRFRVARSVLDTPALRNAPMDKWEDALKLAKERQPDQWAPTIKTDYFDKFIVVWTVGGETLTTPPSNRKAALQQAEVLLREHGCDLDIALHLNRTSPPPAILFGKKWLNDWCRKGFDAVL